MDNDLIPLLQKSINKNSALKNKLKQRRNYGTITVFFCKQKTKKAFKKCQNKQSFFAHNKEFNKINTINYF